MIRTLADSAILLFVLLNPFLLSVYLSSLVRELDGPTFRLVVLRASLIATPVFFLFAWIGDAIFTDVLQARYAAFQIFGGLIFLTVGFRFVMEGAHTIHALRGDPRHLSGSVAMPFMIGPATVSASIAAGSQLSPGLALLAILFALTGTNLGLIIVKALHDRFHTANSAIVARYWEITGRVMALLIGTLAVEMIMRGVDAWLAGR